MKLWLILISLAVVFRLPAFASADPAPPVDVVANMPDRISVPTAADQKLATKLIDDVFGVDIAAAKTPEQKAALAKKLLQAGLDEQKDMAGRYVLLALAKDNAAAAADVEGAMAASDQIAKFYVVDALQLKLEALEPITKATVSPAARVSIAESCDEEIDEAVNHDRYDLAKKFSDLALANARHANNPKLIIFATNRSTDVDAILKAYESTAPDLKILETMPSAPAANAAVGRFRCFVKGDWSGGLSMLVLGNDLALKAIAERELSGKSDPDEQAAVGDAWWDAADQQQGLARTQIRRHAASLYGECVAALSGLAKARVEKRLAQIGPVGHSGKITDLLALADPVRDSVTGRWRLRAGSLISAKSDGAARLEFPYEPGEEYDYTVEFTRLEGDSDVTLGLTKSGKSFCFSFFGSRFGNDCVFGPIKGSWADGHNPSRRTAPIVSGRRYRCVVKVRNGCLEAYLDGLLVCHWDGDVSEMTLSKSYAPRDRRFLALGSYRSSVAFHSAVVTEIHGSRQHAGVGGGFPGASGASGQPRATLPPPGGSEIHTPDTALEKLTPEQRAIARGLEFSNVFAGGNEGHTYGGASVHLNNRSPVGQVAEPVRSRTRLLCVNADGKPTVLELWHDVKIGRKGEQTLYLGGIENSEIRFNNADRTTPENAHVIIYLANIPIWQGLWKPIGNGRWWEDESLVKKK